MKIKRIICLLLATACMFALLSCGGSKAEAFVKIAKNSAPTKITTLTSVNDGEETLTGRYETTVNGTEYEMVYEQQFYNTVSADANSEEYIKTVTGKVLYKNGLYSTDGENWSTQIPDASAMGVKLTLSEKNLGKFTVSADGRTLTTTITSEQAKAILGIDVAATDDAVSLEIGTDGVYLRSIVVSYATENAENITINTTYSYEAIAAPEDGGEE